MRKSAGGGVTTLGLGFVNSGTIETMSTTNELSLGLQGDATSTGTFAPAAGTTIRLQGGGLTFGNGTAAHILNAASSASGPGTIAFSGDATNIIGNFNPGITSITGGTVSFDAAVTATALNFSGGTLTGAGPVTFSAASTWSGGTMTGAGIIKTAGGLTINGGTVKDLTNQRTLQTAGTTSITAPHSHRLQHRHRRHHCQHRHLGIRVDDSERRHETRLCRIRRHLRQSGRLTRLPVGVATLDAGFTSTGAASDGPSGWTGLTNLLQYADWRVYQVEERCSSATLSSPMPQTSCSTASSSSANWASMVWPRSPPTATPGDPQNGRSHAAFTSQPLASAAAARKLRRTASTTPALSAVGPSSK